MREKWTSISSMWFGLHCTSLIIISGSTGAHATVLSAIACFRYTSDLIVHPQSSHGPHTSNRLLSHCHCGAKHCTRTVQRNSLV
jgi:hypothetical protein